MDQLVYQVLSFVLETSPQYIQCFLEEFGRDEVQRMSLFYVLIRVSGSDASPETLESISEALYNSMDFEMVASQAAEELFLSKESTSITSSELPKEKSRGLALSFSVQDSFYSWEGVLGVLESVAAHTVVDFQVFSKFEECTRVASLELKEQEDEESYVEFIASAITSLASKCKVPFLKGSDQLIQEQVFDILMRNIMSYH